MTMWVNYRANATLDVINKTSFISMSLYKTNRTRITYHRPNEKSNRKAMYIVYQIKHQQGNHETIVMCKTKSFFKAYLIHYLSKTMETYFSFFFWLIEYYHHGIMITCRENGRAISQGTRFLSSVSYRRCSYECIQIRIPNCPEDLFDRRFPFPCRSRQTAACAIRCISMYLSAAPQFRLPFRAGIG